MPFEYPTNYSNNTVVESVGDFFFDWVPAIVPEFGIGIVVMFWLAIFSLNLYLGNKDGITVASFITLIISTILFWAGMITIIVPIILLILVIIGVIFRNPGGSNL